MHQVGQKNEMIFKLAQKNEKDSVAATDTHSVNVGKIFTLAKGKIIYLFQD
jgi:hypothetical protein